jgi:hypothetical protein
MSPSPVSAVTVLRRENLKAWMEGKRIPREEKSYFSQLLNGAAPFGERAARRIENDYGMEKGYLDRPLKEQSREEIISLIVQKLDKMSMHKLTALSTLLDE